METSVDVVVIGGGIAGISLAARIAAERRVVVLEAEEHPGMHATGRSAALFEEMYGSPLIRALTSHSRAFFEAPPAGFSEVPLARVRGSLVLAMCAEQEPQARADFESAGARVALQWLDQAQVLALCPVLRPEAVHCGFYEPGAMDIDTDALLQGFARQLRQVGGRIQTRAPVRSVVREQGQWRVQAGDHTYVCDVVVNAAGAWAGEVAALAGVAGPHFQPMRRTAATLPLPAAYAGLPTTSALDASFYFRPEAGDVMVSLSEETPFPACDAYPDDLDVAIAVERLHEATTIPRARPRATWAGLRTFTPDRNPLVGYDAHAPGFFWCAGQGGYGIQTSPALSALAAQLLLRTPVDAALQSVVQGLSSARFHSQGALA